MKRDRRSVGRLPGSGCRGAGRIRHRSARRRRRRAPDARERGLTLVEVLVAIAILGTALTPLVVLMRGGLEAGRRIASVSRSLTLAEHQYEELKCRVQSVRPPYGYELDYSETATAFAAPDQEFRRVIDDDRSAGLRTLRIQVWHDTNGSGTVDGDEIPVVLDARIADRR